MFSGHWDRWQTSVRSSNISHTLILSHVGAQKTTTYLRENVWWRGLNQDIEAFCGLCCTCHTIKSSDKKPYGLLSKLEVPQKITNCTWSFTGVLQFKILHLTLSVVYYFDWNLMFISSIFLFSVMYIWMTTLRHCTNLCSQGEIQNLFKKMVHIDI